MLVAAALFMLTLVISSTSSNAQKLQDKYFDNLNSNGVIIDGYDPVAFFTDSMPVKGSANYSYNWKGADWLFASTEHLDQFKADPEKYAPQFGGYCAYGCSQGHKAPTKPETWTIVSGKLYLNYNGDVKKMWTADRDALIEKANTNWPTVKTQK